MATPAYPSSSINAARLPVRKLLLAWTRLTSVQVRPLRTRARTPVLEMPQRFGDSYRWADGTWTQSG